MSNETIIINNIGTGSAILLKEDLIKNKLCVPFSDKDEVRGLRSELSWSCIYNLLYPNMEYVLPDNCRFAISPVAEDYALFVIESSPSFQEVCFEGENITLFLPYIEHIILLKGLALVKMESFISRKSLDTMTNNVHPFPFKVKKEDIIGSSDYDETTKKVISWFWNNPKKEVVNENFAGLKNIEHWKKISKETPIDVIKPSMRLGPGRMIMEIINDIKVSYDLLSTSKWFENIITKMKFDKGEVKLNVNSYPF